MLNDVVVDFVVPNKVVLDVDVAIDVLVDLDVLNAVSYSVVYDVVVLLEVATVASNKVANVVEYVVVREVENAVSFNAWNTNLRLPPSLTYILLTLRRVPLSLILTNLASLNTPLSFTYVLIAI